jgi:protein phosphatase
VYYGAVTQTSQDPAPQPLPLTLRAVARTDVGRQREQNEDALYVDERAGVFVVCDGMGGHASGQIAAQLAVSVIAESLRGAGADGVEPLLGAMQAANAAVYGRSQRDPACHGMGTTAVGIRADRGVVHACHCGDSRLYLLRGGQLIQLTRDHSLANLYQEQPELEQRMGPATSNVIVRAIGLDATADIEHRVIELSAGDLFLLCCDGLTDLVSDRRIHEVLTSRQSLDAIGDALVADANANGGTDNITVVLVAVEIAPERDHGFLREIKTRPGF